MQMKGKHLSKKLQAKLTPTPRAWRLYLGKEAIEEGSGVGIYPRSVPDEKMHSYAIRLKFNASDHAMDCEALLAGLVYMLEPKIVNGVGNHKAGIPQPRSFGGNQDKTIS
ncbi:hypothetical protein Tco_0511073 [Tanacetum coccineum]